MWKQIGTVRLIVETQHEATLIPAAAIEQRLRIGGRSLGTGRSGQSETVITNQGKAGTSAIGT